jgi:para-nitrobenzyl esterase
VPIINGSTRDEWRLFVALEELAGLVVTAENYVDRIAATLGVPSQVAAAIAEEYPLSAFPSPALALSAVGTDVIFACPALTVNNMVSRFVPTFGYEFNDRNAPELLPPVSFPQGAAHAVELQYLFRMAVSGSLTPDQERLASTMRWYWTDFAEDGTPGRATWPRFEPATQRLLSLVPPRPRVETDFAAVHNCDFWSRHV